MTKHLCSSILTCLVAALFSTAMAPAIAKQQCSASAPSTPQGYWSWRMIDGRKCWYEGKPMLSKSSLEWSASGRPAVKPEPEKVASALPEKASSPAEKSGDPLDAQARVIDHDTFDALWRARVGR
jgi:hypothetical protein